MRDISPCELDWIARAPQVVQVSAHLVAPPARVFASLADASSWPSWFPMMTQAAWRDGDVGGLGHEREVTLRGLGRFRERFVAWDEPRRFAFTVIAAQSPLLRQFGEDYRLSADGDGTRLDWTLGVDAVGPTRLLAPGLRVAMRQLLTRAARNLDQRLARTSAATA